MSAPLFAPVLTPGPPSLGIVQYLDDVIFGAASARESLASAQILINALRRFGWLVHPTKCVGTSVAVQAFQALGAWVDPLTQSYRLLLRSPRHCPAHPGLGCRLAGEGQRAVWAATRVAVECKRLGRIAVGPTGGPWPGGPDSANGPGPGPGDSGDPSQRPPDLRVLSPSARLVAIARDTPAR